MVRNGNGMLFEADGTVYSGPFLLGLKDGFGVEKAPDGSVYEGPFFSGRRHGVGLVTSMVPRVLTAKAASQTSCSISVSAPSRII